MPGKHHGKIHLRTAVAQAGAHGGVQTELKRGRRHGRAKLWCGRRRGRAELWQSSAERLGDRPDEAQAGSQPDAQSGAVMLALARSGVGSARAGWGADGAQTMQKNLAFSCNDLYLPD